MTVIVAVVLFFLGSLLLISFFFRERTETFLAYFLHSRQTTGFVLAMTLIATYGSVSTFVSGPGLAWSYGLSWVVFAAPQIITGFLILGVIGYKLSIVSRKIRAITIIDVIRARYDSSFLCAIIGVATLMFFLAMMSGQFTGGARILAYATGYDYIIGLLIFGLTTVGFTTFGGFRAVVITDTICAILMLIGMGFLIHAIVTQGGGMDQIGLTLSSRADIGERFMSLDSGGHLPLGMLLSAWVLVGFATIALPQSAIRCMAFEKPSDMRLAMLLGVIVCGLLMLGMTFVGVLVRAVIPDASAFGQNTDNLIPYFICQKMNPWVAGITLIAPLAATMSTVSSLLISASSTLIKDLIDMNDKFRQESVFLAKIMTFVFGVLSIFLALDPLDVIAWVNLFAFGGLEITYLTPLIGGLFWAKPNDKAALASIVTGLVTYLICLGMSVHILGTHAIVPAVFVSCVVYFVVGLFAKTQAREAFFPNVREDV